MSYKLKSSLACWEKNESNHKKYDDTSKLNTIESLRGFSEKESY